MSSDSPFQPLGLKAVINAAGKMTALGGTAQSDAVANALAHAAQHHVEIEALKAVASARIASSTQADAGCVTSGAASGIAVGVAAMICRDDLELVRQLPDPAISKREIVLPANHNVNFGAHVAQMIRLGGGLPRLVEHDLAASFTANTAGMVFVQSHHVRGKTVELEAAIAVCRNNHVPLLVDAAAEENLTKYTTLGADLVTYSGGKAIGGPTVGFIAGVADLIAACELQSNGIARAMKVGKEQIAALLVALAEYEPGCGDSGKIDRLYRELDAIAGLNVSIEQDLAGRSIDRVGIRSNDIDWLRGLVRHLSRGEPAIHSRNHLVPEGLLLLDVREVRTSHIETIVQRVGEYVDRAGSGAIA